MGSTSNAASNALEKHGLGFGNLNVLNEHGLIISDYNSWRDYQVCVGIHLPERKHEIFRHPFSFQGRNWALLPKTERAANKEFRIDGVALTRSGRELSRIVDLAPMKEYTQALMEFFEAKGLRMTEVDGPTPIVDRTD